MRACVRSVMIWIRWVGVIRLFGIRGHASLSRPRCWPGILIRNFGDFGEEEGDYDGDLLGMGDWVCLLA